MAFDRNMFYDAVAEFMNGAGVTNVGEILDVEQEERNDGYCETCWYEYTVVVVTYKDFQGVPLDWTYRGDMAEFIRDLTG